MDRYLRVEALVSVRHTTVSMTNPTDRIEIITSVRRRWTASEKVRMVEEKGKVVFRHACLMGLEGIVSGSCKVVRVTNLFGDIGAPHR
jgi:hypothetical protein